MYTYIARYPYISGEKIPLHYYSLLYRQLESIWKELVNYLRENNIEHEIKRHDIIVKTDNSLADDVLTRLHVSFMDIHGFYKGDRLEYREYLEFLRKNYSVSISNLFIQLHDLILNENYDKAFDIAMVSIRKIAETENLCARTGRRIDQLLFEMLHGNIPQTYTNTYLLLIKGCEIVGGFAKQIFLEVAEKSYQIGLLFKKNIELMNKVEDVSGNSIN